MLQIILLLILLASGGEMSGDGSGSGGRGIDIPRKPSTGSFLSRNYPRFLSVGRTHTSDTSHPSNSIELRPRSSSFHPFPSIGHTLDISNPEDVLVEVITRLDLWEAAHAHLRSQGADIYAAFTEDETQFRRRAAEPFFYNKQYRSIIIEDAKRLLLSFVEPSRQLETRWNIPNAESFYNFATWWNECLIQLNFMERPRLSRRHPHPAQTSSDHSNDSMNSDGDSFHTMDSAGSAMEDVFHSDESINGLPGWISSALRPLYGQDEFEKGLMNANDLIVMIGKAVLRRFGSTPKVACYRWAKVHAATDSVHVGVGFAWFLFKVINVMSSSDDFIYGVAGHVCRSIAHSKTLSDSPFVLFKIAANIFNSFTGNVEDAWRALWPGIPLPDQIAPTLTKETTGLLEFMSFYTFASDKDKLLLKAQSELLETIPPWHLLYKEIYHFNAAVITQMDAFIRQHSELFGVSLAILSASDIYDLFLPNHFQSNVMTALLDALAMSLIATIESPRLQSLCRQHLDAVTAQIEQGLTDLITGQTSILPSQPISAAEATAIRKFMSEKIIDAVRPRSSSISYLLSWLNLSSAESTPID